MRFVASLFFDHPDSLGETYLEHMARATGFGAQMILAGTACLCHAVVPALFKDTASRTVTRLHDGIVRRRDICELGPGSK
jgi:hypothetical protein